MHPIRKQRLQIVLFIVLTVSAAVGFLMYVLSDNINLFYPPEEVVAGKAPQGVQIRVGGMVVEGSIKRASDSLKVNFDVTDYKATVPMVYEGLLPDLFAEGEGVVATVKLVANGLFTATEVLAMHEENYRPHEVARTL
jgi:cytochrome c-type biogenesis protein CcmE